MTTREKKCKKIGMYAKEMQRLRDEVRKLNSQIDFLNAANLELNRMLLAREAKQTIQVPIAGRLMPEGVIEWNSP